MKTITVYEFGELPKAIQRRLFDHEYSLVIKSLSWGSLNFPDELRGCSTKPEFHARAKDWATKEVSKVLNRYLYLKNGKEFEKK